MGLSVIVITYNEEDSIARCLDSVRWAEELVVVDAESSDATAEIARGLTPHVNVARWAGYSGAKTFALTKTTQEWILWLDADECVTQELAMEIQAIIQAESRGTSAYEVARRAFFLGKWIKHCGWYPGYVVRLFRKGSAAFTESSVHEKLTVNGRIGRLGNDLLHFTDENLFHYFAKFNRYTSLAAADVKKEGRRFSMIDLFLRPPFLFFKMYVARFGFLDGMHGLVLSLLSAASVFTKYAKLWESCEK